LDGQAVHACATAWESWHRVLIKPATLIVDRNFPTGAGKAVGSSETFPFFRPWRPDDQATVQPTMVAHCPPSWRGAGAGAEKPAQIDRRLRRPTAGRQSVRGVVAGLDLPFVVQPPRGPDSGRVPPRTPSAAQSGSATRRAESRTTIVPSCPARDPTRPRLRVLHSRWPTISPLFLDGDAYTPARPVVVGRGAWVRAAPLPASRALGVGQRRWRCWWRPAVGRCGFCDRGEAHAARRSWR